ncbi:MAG: crossover junction endodeoxyribonuclease RuvC [Candidatus Paceibacterota bacterium]
MKIVAIDPGYERLGVAILEKVSGSRETLLFSECFKTLAIEKHEKRLNLIGAEVSKIIKKYKPGALAIETLFFETNAKTAMKVSEARGVILYEAAKNGLTVREFTPLEIKVAVTGYGKSDKRQIIDMVDRLIEIKKEIKHDDEYDAIAVGLTYFATIKSFPQA